jgi:hypothetical protein
VQLVVLAPPVVVVVVPVVVPVVGVTSSLPPQTVGRAGAEAAPINRLLRKCFLSMLAKGISMLRELHKGVRHLAPG